jgi:AcrR family transcriptional regulator
MTAQGPVPSAAATFVARDERERLFVALAELIDERGHENVATAAVARRAGLSHGAFERYFDSIQECLLGAFEAAAEQAYTASADAYMRTPGSWGEAVHAALAELLGFLAGSPELTRMCVVEVLYAGSPALERRDRVLARFAGFLEPGYAESPNPPPEVVSEAISGGVYELIRAHAMERRVESLPHSLPEATVIALSPFVGSAEAERLAARPARLAVGRP